MLLLGLAAVLGVQNQGELPAAHGQIVRHNCPADTTVYVGWHGVPDEAAAAAAAAAGTLPAAGAAGQSHVVVVAGRPNRLGG